MKCSADPWVYCGHCANQWIATRREVTAIEVEIVRARNAKAKQKREHTRRIVGSIFVYQ